MEYQDDINDGMRIVGRESVMLPQNQEKDEGKEIGVIRELSPRRVLEQLRMNLKGWFFDYEEKKYIPVVGFEPLMNDKGIAKYLSIVSSVITDLVTFSNFNMEEIPKLTLFVCDSAIPVIYLNYREYGVRQKSDLPIITIQIFNLTLAAFKKAVGAGDRGVIGRTISENIMTRSGIFDNPRQMEERRGFFSKINPFSRK